MPLTAPSSRIRALVVALALISAAGACSDDGGDAGSAGSTRPEAETTAPRDADGATTTTVADDDGTTTTTTLDDVAVAEAEALAEAVTLTPDDFVAEGWTFDLPDEDRDTIRDCFVDFDESLVAEHTSPSFLREGEAYRSQVTTTGLVMTDADTASSHVDEVATDPFVACVEETYREGLGDDLLAVTLGVAPDAAPVGEQSAALEGTLSVVDSDGSPLDAELALWMIRTGPVLTAVSVAVFGQPDPGLDVPSLVADVTTLMGDRQAAEVG